MPLATLLGKEGMWLQDVPVFTPYLEFAQIVRPIRCYAPEQALPLTPNWRTRRFVLIDQYGTYEEV